MKDKNNSKIPYFFTFMSGMASMALIFVVAMAI